MTPTKAVIIVIALCVGAQLLQLKHNSFDSEMILSDENSPVLGLAISAGLQSLLPLKQSKSPQVLDEDIANIETALFSILSSDNDTAASVFVEKTPVIETASGSNLSPGSDLTPSLAISSFTSKDNQEKLLAKISHGDSIFPNASSDTETKSPHEITPVTAEDTIDDDDSGVVKTTTNIGWPHRVQSSSEERHVSETVSGADSEDVPSPLEHDGAEENYPLLGLAFVEETPGIETVSGSNLSPGSKPTPSRVILSFTSDDNQEKLFDKISGDSTFPNVLSDTETKALHEIPPVTAEDTIDDILGVAKPKTKSGWPHRVQSSNEERHVSETVSGADSEDVPSPLEHDEGLGFRFFYVCGESFNASEPDEYRCLMNSHNTKNKRLKKQPGVSIRRKVKRYTARSRKLSAGIKKRALQSLEGFRDGYIALVENDEFFL